MKIETLKDMLCEVKKFCKNAEIIRDSTGAEFDLNQWDALVYNSNDLDFYIADDDGQWLDDCNGFKSENLKDLLDAYKSIHNCGKPEEEKVK